MAESLTLKTNKAPSFLNKDLLVGGIVGNLIAPGFGTVVGGAIGSLIGKRRMQDELENGKTVSTRPTLLNKEAFIGGAAGSLLSGIAASAGFYLSTGATFTQTAEAIGAASAAGAETLAVATAGGTIAMTAGTVALGLGVALLAAAAVVAVGAYIGGRMGKAQQQNELIEARTQQLQELSQGKGKEREREQGHDVSQSMEMDHEKRWTKQIEAEPAQAQTQSHEMHR